MLESSNTGVLRCAQDDSIGAFFRSLLSPRGAREESEMRVFVDRKSESRRLENAILERQSLMICGPAGIGKTALVAKVIAGLPAGLAGRCLEIPGARDLPDLLRQLVRRLYEAEDPNLARQLRSEGVSARGFAAWVKKLSTSRLKGTVYRTLERGDYRIFLDHLPRLTKTVAKVVKELFWMRNTPVYLLIRDAGEQHLDPLYNFFYWGDRERLALPPLPAQAAAELLESCVGRFALAGLDLSGFREKVLELSQQVPGAIVKMCMLAADRRYQYESRIKIKSVYIDYLLSGHDLHVPAPGSVSESPRHRVAHGARRG